MPVLLVMDLMGMAAFRKDVDRRLLRFLLPFGLVGVAIGTLLFRVLDANVVAGIVGGFTLLFLAQRLLFPPRPDSPPPPRWLGALLITTSGFTSFIAHAGGPPINAYVIPLRLSPVLFTGTMGVFLLFHQPRQVAALRLAGPAGPAQLRHVAGAAAAGAAGGGDRCAHRATNPAGAVLPVCVRRHGAHRAQAAVGCGGVKS
jgi:uncharacterized membrane protein YfcA